VRDHPPFVAGTHAVFPPAAEARSTRGPFRALDDKEVCSMGHGSLFSIFVLAGAAFLIVDSAGAERLSDRAAEGFRGAYVDYPMTACDHDGGLSCDQVNNGGPFFNCTFVDQSCFGCTNGYDLGGTCGGSSTSTCRQVFVKQAGGEPCGQKKPGVCISSGGFLTCSVDYFAGSLGNCSPNSKCTAL
jgi:hypothetical protein